MAPSLDPTKNNAVAPCPQRFHGNYKCASSKSACSHRLQRPDAWRGGPSDFWGGTSPLKNGCSPPSCSWGEDRTLLPTSSENLQPRTPDFQELAAFERSQRQRQKNDYDRRHGVRDLPQQSEGTPVWIVDLQKEGDVRGSSDEPRSHWVDSGEIALISSRCRR
ncbi:hypothetical protein MTO96_024258 [Rhipicephalus appendiculatus]